MSSGITSICTVGMLQRMQILCKLCQCVTILTQSYSDILPFQTSYTELTPGPHTIVFRESRPIQGNDNCNNVNYMYILLQQFKLGFKHL